MSDERHIQEGPATFREVFAQTEYRAIYIANTLSWVGDYIARAAVTVLIYHQTESVALSAAAFAVSYLPWLAGGPLLATIAERQPYRRVMVACDLIRMALIALIAIPSMPVAAILPLLFLTTLANPPTAAAKSALLPVILTGDRLVVGLSLNTSTGQAAQVIGYLLGSVIAAASPTAALLINATTFGLSALIVRLGVRHRPSPMTSEQRSHLLRETADGFRIVFGTPVLRAIAIVVFAAMLFAIVPEGLAAAWAGERTDGGFDQSTAQAVIMAANPIGFILGGLVMARAVRPAARVALLRPFAVLAPLALVPALLDPPPLVVAFLSAVCGFAVAGLLPVANGLFVQALREGYRARAFGVMGTGVQVIQGLAVLLTGALADRFTIPEVVGWWSVAGVALMLISAAQWPSRERFDEAIRAAKASRAGADAPVARPAVGAETNAPAAQPAQ